MRQEPSNAEIWNIQCERHVAFGGYIHLLLTCGNEALLIETKIWDNEKLHQYISYSKCLEEEGYRVCCIGILGRKDSTLRGRRHLLQAFFQHAADARILWGDLVHALEGPLLGNVALERLRSALNEVDPLLSSAQSSRPSKISPPDRDLALISTRPDSCIQFFLDYVEALGTGFEYSPSQAGNSPLGVVIGRELWGEWFKDGYAARLNLAFATPRPSDPDIEPHFHFTAVLWNKTPCHGRLHEPRVRYAAKAFSSAGFRVIRNVKGDWHHQEDWSPPFEVSRTGFYYANAYDAHNFTLPLTRDVRLTWDDAIRRLLQETGRIVSIFDAMMASH